MSDFMSIPTALVTRKRTVLFFKTQLMWVGLKLDWGLAAAPKTDIVRALRLTES